jgi:RNA polymerase sigma-70 factor, ECF subfamily
VKSEFERASASAAPLDQVKQSVHSDLQYVSLQVDGKTYGGWYRMLPDGQIELLALANMHCERRAENTPVEQARGMLADFIHAARPAPKGNGSSADHAPAKTNGHEPTSGTLGALLYADRDKARVPEDDWVRLVESIAAGDELALYSLFERSHRIVFTLLMRVTHDRETAEELTLDVFQSVWRYARDYDAAKESVLGWVMNQARSRAIDEQRHRRLQDASIDAAQSSALTNALTVLTEDERQLIEALFFSELGYDELAVQQRQQSATVRTRVHSGLEKLRHALTTAEKE